MRVSIAVMIAVLFVVIAECVPPSAMEFDRVVLHHQTNRFGGIELTPWHTSAGAQIYECWWQIGLNQSVHFVTIPPAVLANSARQMSWLQAACCIDRLWIPFTSFIAGLIVFLALTGRRLSKGQEVLESPVHDCPPEFSAQAGDPRRVLPAIMDE